MAAAENEVAKDPERFLRTYNDKWGLRAAVEEHQRFLLLGPKGTGKSAGAHYLRLSWERELGPHAVFSKFLDFDELNRSQSPLASLDKKLVGDVPALTDTAWRLFIGVRLLESLLSDPMCSLSRDPQVISMVSRLREHGLASDDFPQVLRRVRERKASFNIPKFAGYEGTSKEASDANISQLSEAVISLVVNAQTTNRHLLAIDGLDKAIGDNAAYWQTLAALVRVVDSLTRQLRRLDLSHAYVLVMCRSDIFRRVRFADAAKIAADGAVYMDWAAEAEDPKRVHLWDYLSLKAEVDIGTLFEFLPGRVDVGIGNSIEIDRYLLQFTRYTPRDMTLLFNTLRDTQPIGMMTNAEVRQAADTFASRHLLTEMMSEATGLLPEALIDRFEQILSASPSRILTRDAFREALVAEGIEETKVLNSFAEYLFLQGALGNYRPGVRYVQFYHRRDAYKWHKSGPWIIHTGLVYAFNIPWSENSSSRSQGRRRKRRTVSAQVSLPAVTAASEPRAQRPSRVRRRLYQADGEPPQGSHNA